MKVLITGFDPFGGESTNPAYEAVKLLPDKIGEIDVIKVEIPTVFHKSVLTIEKYIDEYSPDFVICVGQAGGRADITVERVGINVDDARIPDNEGNQPIDEPIAKDGPAAYFSTLPIKAIVKTIRDSGLPVSVSNSAGTYVCNHVMYGLLHLLKTKYTWIKGGFIHVPYCEKQVVDKFNMPSMSLGSISKALEIIIEVTGRTDDDIRMTDGYDC